MEGRTPCWAAPHARKPLPPLPPHFTTHLGWCDGLLSQGWGRTLLTCQVPTAPQNLLFLLLSPFLGQLCRLPAVLQQPQCQAARASRAIEPLPAPLCPPQTQLCTQLLATGTENGAGAGEGLGKSLTLLVPATTHPSGPWQVPWWPRASADGTD